MRNTKPRSLRKRTWLLTQVIRRLVARPFMRLKLLCTYTVVGTEHIPKQGGVLIAGNHPSVFDPIALAIVIKRNAAFLAKAELWRHRLMRYFMHSTGQIPVDRGNRESGRLARQLALQVLTYGSDRGASKGGVVLMFPEGGCTPHEGPGAGTMRPFKSGPWHLANDSDRPVVPVGIVNIREILQRRGGKRPHVVIIFGEPMHAKDYANQDAFLQALRARIEELVRQGQSTTHQPS